MHHVHVCGRFVTDSAARHALRQAAHPGVSRPSGLPRAASSASRSGRPEGRQCGRDRPRRYGGARHDIQTPRHRRYRGVLHPVTRQAPSGSTGVTGERGKPSTRAVARWARPASMSAMPAPPAPKPGEPGPGWPLEINACPVGGPSPAAISKAPNSLRSSATVRKLLFDRVLIEPGYGAQPAVTVARARPWSPTPRRSTRRRRGGRRTRPANGRGISG